MQDEEEAALRDVIWEEKSRGRHPANTDILREHQERLELCRALLHCGTEKDFRNAILALGVKDESPEFLEALGIWRAYRGY